MRKLYSKDIWRSYLDESKIWLKMVDTNAKLSTNQTRNLINKLERFNILIDFWQEMSFVIGQGK